jgi:hypothetical protein
METNSSAQRGRAKEMLKPHKLQYSVEDKVVRRMRHIAADRGVNVPALYREAFDEYLARRDASGELIEGK